MRTWENIILGYWHWWLSRLWHSRTSCDAQYRNYYCKTVSCRDVRKSDLIWFDRIKSNKMIWFDLSNQIKSNQITFLLLKNSTKSNQIKSWFDLINQIKSYQIILFDFPITFFTTIAQKRSRPRWKAGFSVFSTHPSTFSDDNCEES